MSNRRSSPVPTSAADGSKRRRSRDPEYQAAQERLAPYERIARFVITRRAELGLTQEQLAERMGTSHSAISRIESGQHRSSVATLERLSHALEVRFVMGFETGSGEAPVREQAWFWSPVWQAGESEASAELARGGDETFESDEALLAALDD